MDHYPWKFLGDFVLHYLLDDRIINSKTYEEHLEDICRVQEALLEKKLYAEGSKCEFMRPSDLLRVHCGQGKCGQGEFQGGGGQELAHPEDSA